MRSALILSAIGTQASKAAYYNNSGTAGYPGTNYANFAACYMVQSRTGTICPNYNGKYYTSPAGKVYQMWCQTDIQTGGFGQLNYTGSVSHSSLIRF